VQWVILSLDEAITVYSNSQQTNTTQKMMKRGKTITYLKLNTSSVKGPADPAVKVGGEVLGMNLLRWEMKLNNTKVLSNTPSRIIIAASIHSKTNGDVLLVLQMDDNVHHSFIIHLFSIYHPHAFHPSIIRS
jgi:hypothetical protein